MNGLREDLYLMRSVPPLIEDRVGRRRHELTLWASVQVGWGKGFVDNNGAGAGVVLGRGCADGSGARLG